LEDHDPDLADDVGIIDPDFVSISTEPAWGSTDEPKHCAPLPGLRNPLVSLFSVRWFGIATAASLVGVFLAGGIPLPFSGFLGIFVVGAAVGLIKTSRHYVEMAIGGALVAGIAVFFDVLILVLFGVGVPLVAIAALLGAVIGVVGHYAGRDLRTGLTRDL
jgi:hypothetical protein